MSEEPNIGGLLLACDHLVSHGIPKSVARMIIMYTDPEYWAKKASDNNEYYWCSMFAPPLDPEKIKSMAMAINILQNLSGQRALRYSA